MARRQKNGATAPTRTPEARDGATAPTRTPEAREPFHILLSADDRETLDRLARGENRTRADMVRQLIVRAGEAAE
jgi:hypothetical protein